MFRIRFYYSRFIIRKFVRRKHFYVGKCFGKQRGLDTFQRSDSKRVEKDKKKPSNSYFLRAERLALTKKHFDWGELSLFISGDLL